MRLIDADELIKILEEYANDKDCPEYGLMDGYIIFGW